MPSTIINNSCVICLNSNININKCPSPRKPNVITPKHSLQCYLNFIPSAYVSANQVSVARNWNIAAQQIN
jgi:hypothetical protein